MQHYNVLVGCDQKYYNDWAENLILSIRHFNPWLTCHVHIVNPKKYKIESNITGNKLPKIINLKSAFLSLNI